MFDDQSVGPALQSARRAGTRCERWLPARYGVRTRARRQAVAKGAGWNPSALTRVVAESAEHNPHAEPALGDRRLNERADERVLGELLEREIEVATLKKRSWNAEGPSSMGLGWQIPPRRGSRS